MPRWTQQDEGDGVEMPRWTQQARCTVLDVSRWMWQDRTRTAVWGRLCVLAGGTSMGNDGLGPTILHGLRWLGSPELWLRRWPLQGHTATQDRAPRTRYKPMPLPVVWGR